MPVMVEPVLGSPMALESFPPGKSPCPPELNTCHSVASLKDSVKRPSFFESTCDTANMTTKKAKSSVMKSA